MCKGVGRKFSREGGQRRRSKNSKKIALLSLFQGEEGQRKKTLKNSKKKTEKYHV